MPTFERQGATIFYEVTGEGPPVLLGHSLLMDGRMWDDVLPALAKKLRCYNIEVRGHRHSRSGGPFTLEDLADDWFAIMDREKLDKAVLCGLSMGGMTAMRMALARPERVKAMALLDTNADPETTFHRYEYLAFAEAQKYLGRMRFLQPIVERAFFGASSRRDRRAIVEREVGRLLDKEPATYYHAIHAVMKRESIVDRLAAIRCPTLVLVGDEDMATPPSRSERIARAIRGAELVKIPRAGHLAPLEQPALVEQALLPFLTKHA